MNGRGGGSLGAFAGADSASFDSIGSSLGCVGFGIALLVPFAYLFAFRYVLTVWKEIWAFPLVRPLIFTLLIFAHFVPFLVATRRHLDWPNHRQEGLMRFAEQLTDPVKDPVYDGIGLVPAQRSIHFHWLLRSPNIRDFRKGGELRVRDVLAERPAAVITQSYRTDWLPEEDHEFIRERYVPPADDLWVSGRTLPAGGAEFEIHHPGCSMFSPGSGVQCANRFGKFSP